MSEDRKKHIEQLRVLRDKADAMDISPERRAWHKAAGKALAEDFLKGLAIAEELATFSGTSGV